MPRAPSKAGRDLVQPQPPDGCTAVGSAHLPALLGRIAQAPAASRVVACPPVPATKIAYPAALSIEFFLV